MIKSVGDKLYGRVDAPRVGVDRTASTAKAAPTAGEPGRAEAPVTAAAEMASQGAPVDAAKTAAIKAAIAEGRYPVDPAKIADAMIAFGKAGDQ